MNEHFQHEPKHYIKNSRSRAGSPDPFLTLVAMALCVLGSWWGRAMGRWHTGLLLLLGLGPASLSPPFSLHPAAAGSSQHLPAGTSSVAASSADSPGQYSGGATNSQAPRAVPLQTTAPILWLCAPALEKPSSSCSWASSRLPLHIPH